MATLIGQTVSVTLKKLARRGTEPTALLTDEHVALIEDVLTEALSDIPGVVVEVEDVSNGYEVVMNAVKPA